MLTLIHPVPPQGDLLPVRAQKRLQQATHYYSAVPLDRYLQLWLKNAQPIAKEQLKHHENAVCLGDPNIDYDEWIPALSRAHVEAVEHGVWPQAIGETDFPDPWLDLKVPTVLKTDNLEEAGYAGPQTPLTDGVLLHPAKPPSEKERIIVTRAEDQGFELAERLEQHGAQVQVVPCLQFSPLPAEPLQAALQNEYDWVIFTSVNGVKYFCELAGDVRKLKGAKLAAIGPATAQALRDRFLTPDLVPPKYVAESLLESLPPMKSVLIARAEEARDVLPEGLKERGVEVTVIPVYRTTAPERREIEEADLVFFTSSSTVKHFRELTQEDIPVLAIGPVTAQTAREHGFTHVEESPVHTVDGMVSYWSASRRPQS